MTDHDSGDLLQEAEAEYRGSLDKAIRQAQGQMAVISRHYGANSGEYSEARKKYDDLCDLRAERRLQERRQKLATDFPNWTAETVDYMARLSLDSMYDPFDDSVKDAYLDKVVSDCAPLNAEQSDGLSRVFGSQSVENASASPRTSKKGNGRQRRSQRREDVSTKPKRIVIKKAGSSNEDGGRVA